MSGSPGRPVGHKTMSCCSTGKTDTHCHFSATIVFKSSCPGHPCIPKAGDIYIPYLGDAYIPYLGDAYIPYPGDAYIPVNWSLKGWFAVKRLALRTVNSSLSNTVICFVLLPSFYVINEWECYGGAVEGVHFSKIDKS